MPFSKPYLYPSSTCIRIGVYSHLMSVAQLQTCTLSFKNYLSVNSKMIGQPCLTYFFSSCISSLLLCTVLYSTLLPYANQMSEDAGIEPRTVATFALAAYMLQ